MECQIVALLKNSKFRTVGIVCRYYVLQRVLREPFCGPILKTALQHWRTMLPHYVKPPLFVPGDSSGGKRKEVRSNATPSETITDSSVYVIILVLVPSQHWEYFQLAELYAHGYLAFIFHLGSDAPFSQAPTQSSFRGCGISDDMYRGVRPRVLFSRQLSSSISLFNS